MKEKLFCLQLTFWMKLMNYQIELECSQKVNDINNYRINFDIIGKLFSMGTSDFMKKQFGEGYHLVITPQYIINFV